jgi:hypothetical protein
VLSRRAASLLLPVEQGISGLVTDSLGHPIAGASVEHTNSTDKELVTDATGHFELSTRAPALVIRKIGYDSAFVRNKNAQSVHITLQPSQGVLAACSSKSLCKTIDGFGSIFCFSKINGVKVSEQGNDIDYGMRIFSIRAKNGRKFVRHGSGPMWSFGIPENEDVWDSIDYSEKTYRAGRAVVVDAKGKTSAGKLWRYIGRLGESASYDDVDQDSAVLLDRVLDGLCIREDKR